MKKLQLVLVLSLAIVFLGGCAVENRVIKKTAWDAQPSDVSIIGEINTQEASAKDFKTAADKWIGVFMEGNKYKVMDGAALTLTYTVDILEPGNRWARWAAGIFGVGQGYVQGKVTVRKGGSVVGSYEYAAVQRGGFFGGTLSDLAMEAARGIANKIHKQKFDEALYDRDKK